MVRIVESATLASLLPNSTGGWIALIVGAIGLAAAAQQLTAAFFRRKYGKAEERMLDILRTQIDAEEVERFAENARRQADDYERQQEALRREIAEQIPREAQRLYLTQRVSTLLDSMGRDYTEYLSRKEELERISGPEPDSLPPQLERFIKDIALPGHLEERKHARQLRVLVIILVALAVSPVSLAQLTANWVYVLFNPLRLHEDETYVAYSVLAIVVAVVWNLPPVWKYVAAYLKRTKETEHPFLRMGFVVGPAAGVLAVTTFQRLNGPYNYPMFKQTVTALGGIALITFGASMLTLAVVSTWPNLRSRLRL